MSNDKAYKLLAKQEKISNKLAKDLIDKGLVFSHGKKIVIARALMKVDTSFKVDYPQKPTILFEDDFLVAVDKPYGETSEDIAKSYNLELLHRLDRETTGVLLLSKNEDFTKKVISAFKSHNVKKEYYAIVEGRIAEAQEINDPISTFKDKNGAFSRVSKDGKEALTFIEPKAIEGSKTLLSVLIKTGRTHQIRAHLKSIGHPIVGDQKYGAKLNSRLLLHSFKIELLGYSIKSKLPKQFAIFGNNA